MLARLLRVLVVAWGIALGAALFHGLVHGWTARVVVPVALLLFAHPALLLAETVAMAVVSRHAGGPRIPPDRLLRAWAGEWVAATWSFGWRMPWREHAEPDHLPAQARARRGVVLVHGFVSNRALWNPLMARLRSAGQPFVALTLEPVFGEIEGYVAQLDDAVARLHAITGRPPVVLAHSMGGLVARAWWHRHASGDAAARVDSVVTIGTPHRGTWLARFGLSPNARQMRAGGPWLTALASMTDDRIPARFTCWWSECDQVVFPPPAAILPGARACQIEGVAHVALSQRREIAEDLLRRLAD